MAAFEAAWRVGADAIELDIQMTADGDAAVIHDPTLEATTDGQGAVSGTSTADLAMLDAGSWFSPAFAGQFVPTLAQVLTWLRSRDNIWLLLEIKDEWPAEPLARVLDAVSAPDVSQRVVVQSFSVATMDLACELAPQLTRELLIDSVEPDLLDICRQLQVGGCNPSGDLLVANPDLLDYLHGARLRVSAWTLNEPLQWALAATAGVDGIITDHPGRLLGWLSAARIPSLV